MLFGTAQNAYAGSPSPPSCPHQPVWDAGDGSDTNCSNAENWLDDDNPNCVPENPYPSSAPRILVGCNMDDEEPLEVEPLCLNEDPSYRNSCAFAKVRELTIDNAEEIARQIMNGKYVYDQIK